MHRDVQRHANRVFDFEVHTGHAVEVEIRFDLGFEARIERQIAGTFDRHEHREPTARPTKRCRRARDTRHQHRAIRIVLRRNAALLRAEGNRSILPDVLAGLGINATEGRQRIGEARNKAAPGKAAIHQHDRIAADVAARSVANAIRRGKRHLGASGQAIHIVAEAQEDRAVIFNFRDKRRRVGAGLQEVAFRCPVQCVVVYVAARELEHRQRVDRGPLRCRECRREDRVGHGGPIQQIGISCRKGQRRFRELRPKTRVGGCRQQRFGHRFERKAERTTVIGKHDVAERYANAGDRFPAVREIGNAGDAERERQRVVGRPGDARYGARTAVQRIVIVLGVLHEPYELTVCGIRVGLRAGTRPQRFRKENEVTPMQRVVSVERRAGCADRQADFGRAPVVERHQVVGGVQLARHRFGGFVGRELVGQDFEELGSGRNRRQVQFGGVEEIRDRRAVKRGATARPRRNAGRKIV